MARIILSSKIEMKNIVEVLKHIEKIEHKKGSITVMGFNYGDYEIKYSIIHNKFGYTISSVRV